MRMDFQMTADGDLALGPQETDNEGRPLYFDSGIASSVPSPEYNERSVPVRTMGTVYGIEAEMQTAWTRLRSETTSWALHETLGADLSDLIGEKNTRETAERGLRKIRDALARDGAFNDIDHEVNVFPYGRNELVFVLTVRQFGEEIRLPLRLDLEVGILDRYEVES